MTTVEFAKEMDNLAVHAQAKDLAIPANVPSILVTVSTPFLHPLAPMDLAMLLIHSSDKSQVYSMPLPLETLLVTIVTLKVYWLLEEMLISEIILLLVKLMATVFLTEVLPAQTLHNLEDMLTLWLLVEILFALNGQVEVGDVYYGGTFNNDPTFQAGAGCGVYNSVPIDFGASEQYLQALSLSVSNLQPTGTVANNYGSIVFTGTNSPTMEVFSIASSDLCPSYGFTITGVQPTAAIFINVAGTSASCGQFGMSGYSPNQAVFNFFEATSLSIYNIQWQGSILAPLAAVTNSNGGAIDGQVFAASVSETNNCIQINWYPFSGCIHD